MREAERPAATGVSVVPLVRCATMIVANITGQGVDTRLRRSVIGFAVVLSALVALASLGAPGWTVGLLFVPLFFVSNMAYQGLFKT